MADTRVVLLNGARQSGKSTLVRMLAQGKRTVYRTLDDARTRAAAIDDPTGFVDAPGMIVIDEVQRVPDLLLAIKADVDRRPTPGRFLLTGSARLLGLRRLPDTLIGRMETIELWPFSQGEIDGRGDAFIDQVFALGPEMRQVSAVTRAEYAARIVRGGFPDVLARHDDVRRERFFDAYVRDLISREISELVQIERKAELRALTRLVAARSGQLLVVSALGDAARLSRSSTDRFVGLLEEVFFLKRIPAWSRNLSTRATGTAKVAVVDSGVAANLLGFDADRLLVPGAPIGPLLEGFVLMELARQISWSRERVELYHYRTRDQVEVDAVLENRRGMVVGIEVKASMTVRSDDFRGLRHLRDRLGPDFVVGIVLHAGTETLPFGDRMRSMPLSALWEVEAAPPPPSRD